MKEQTSQNNLTGSLGEIAMTVEITRAATGEIETHELTGTAYLIDKEGNQDGSNTLNSGA